MFKENHQWIYALSLAKQKLRLSRPQFGRLIPAVSYILVPVHPCTAQTYRHKDHFVIMKAIFVVMTRLDQTTSFCFFRFLADSFPGTFARGSNRSLRWRYRSGQQVSIPNG